MRHLLITGAAGSIGGALARRMRRRWPDAALSLLDRVPPDALAAELDGVSVPFDLQEVGALPTLMATLVAQRGPVDGLVNNAGIMDVGAVQSWDWAAVDRSLAVNLTAPLRLLHLVVPSLPRGGFVVNVASMAGLVPLRGCAAYGASKAALAMASEISRAELRSRGVHVLTVYPGPVSTPLEAAARGRYPNSLLKRLLPTGTAEDLADRVLSAIELRRARVIHPAVYSVAAGPLRRLFAAFALAMGPDARERTE